MGKGRKDQRTPGPVPDPESASGPDSEGPEPSTAAEVAAPPPEASGGDEPKPPGLDGASAEDTSGDEPAAAGPGDGDAGKNEGAVDGDAADVDTPVDTPANTRDVETADLGTVEIGATGSGATDAESVGADTDDAGTARPDADGTATPRLLPAAPPVAVGRPTRRRRRWRRVLVAMAVTTAILAGAAAAGAYVLYHRLDGQITTEDVAEKIGPSRPPVMPEAYGAVNILLMGSDDRTGENIKYGDTGEGTKRSDTTILLHLAADRKSSVAVSIPRDLMVQIPSCVRDDGTSSRAYRDQFNHAFEIGGSACTIKTVELMTQVHIDHHIVVDFTGFKRMVDTVDGVEVCLSEPLRDSAAKLDLAAGQQKLNGEQSLAYVRARKNLGDGSDTQRMARQQRFLASLLSKVKSNGVLFNPVKLYDLLDAGTRSITADPGLDSLDELTKLSKSVSNIPSDKSAFLTVPRQQYRYDTNRDELVQPDADALFTAIRYDRLAVAKSEPGATEEPGGSVHIDETNMPVAPGSSSDSEAESLVTTDPDGGSVTVRPTKPSASPTEGASADATATTAPGTTASTTREPGTGASPDTKPTGMASPANSSAGPSPTGGVTPPPPSAVADSSPGATSATPPSATPSEPAGPIVTVTGRTVDQDVCS